jgi:hypothetical protein
LQYLENSLAKIRQDLTPYTYVGALLGGVLLGGIALALLNRKTIQELREKLDERAGSSPDDIY